jgi:tripartite-type tricarboxylate transporter receptor subunit TctC
MVIIAKLNGAIVAALKDPAMQERTRSLGASPMPFSPPEFVRYIRSEYQKWAAVVAQIGAKEP